MSVFSIESAAGWVGKLLVQEMEFLAEVRDKVESLQSEMEWIQCALKDADRKQSKSQVIHKWLLEIRDSAHESEDVIETYILKVSHKRPNPARAILTPYWTDLKWFLCLCMDASELHKVGRDIDNLTAKIKLLNSRAKAYGIESSNQTISDSYLVSEGRLIEQRRTYSHTEDDVVGLDEKVRDVADKMVTGQYKVVVLYGMGGIGKTTLAREVYRYIPLKTQFDGFAWAYASQQLQLRPLCKAILLQLIPVMDGDDDRRSIEALQDTELIITKLHQVLSNRKCLVVIDDIWSASDWKLLQPAFPLKNGCSKIIVTTRKPHILPRGSYGDATLYYEAQLLNSERSWQLFQSKSRFTQDDAEPFMFDLGHKMLSHCKGHPLAIVVLGGILATKKTCLEWQDVYDNLPLHLRGDHSVDGDQLYSGVYGVLELSYYDLPYHLKACFLHLGYFPEDFEIPVERIYHLWIAEGIVSTIQDPVDKSMEEIAKVYLSELVQRGMVQISTWNYTDEYIMYCKLHDLMRDKCLQISKEENFLQSLSHYPHIGDHDQLQTLASYVRNDRLRRLAMYVGHHGIHTSLKHHSSLENVSSLRSLVFFAIATNEVQEENCEWIENISKDFQLLRILDFTGVPIAGRLPKCIGNLIYLRYLSLWNTRVTKLPTEIGKLRSLLILDLRVSNVVIWLPNVLSRLTSLRQLYFPCRNLSIDSRDEQGYEIENGEKLSLDNLSKLQEIVDVDLDTVDANGILRLTNMQRLAASCVNKKESLDPFLKSSSMKTLKLKIKALVLVDHPKTLSDCDFLHWLHIDNDKDRMPNLCLPISSGMFPNNLVELGFWYCQLSEDSIYVLGELPQLKSLQLHICYRGHKLHFSDKLFPEVTHLIIDGLWFLEEWTMERGSLPKLKKLEIYFSPIQMLPDALAQEVIVHCKPCVKGIERFGTCSFDD